ncbi:MAG: hypothetical protein CME19_07895 [Gemmatimonadetes bacterium]|nr:hypothetical protein [Gemmatimonadota bacterium]
MKRIILAGLLGFTVWACAQDSAPKPDAGNTSNAAHLEGESLNLGGISVTSPAAWQSQPPSSSMRKAQFVLPGQGGGGDAELVVFYFGAGNAGSVEMNLQRWRGQMKGAEGETTKGTVNGMPVTTLDVSGSYAASMGPMMQSGPEKSGYRMVASIVESPAGAYYFKLTGPQETVSHWKQTFDQFIASAKAS